jgi:hypothetical protein
MKRLFVIVCLLFLGYRDVSAQLPGKLDSFRNKILPGYALYFSQAGLTTNGILDLTGTGAYADLSPDAKADVVMKVMAAGNDSIVKVRYGSKCELWGWSNESGGLQLLDSYDENARLIPRAITPGARPNPWFFYVGGQFGGDNQNNINLALNLRLGFFMLMNRWDMATTLSGGVSGNTVSDNSGMAWANAGFMSRVHFPIRKIRLSPNAGGEVTVSVYGSAAADVSAALVVGAGWFVGPGNLDFAVHIGKEVTASFGYTFMFGHKKNK